MRILPLLLLAACAVEEEAVEPLLDVYSLSDEVAFPEGVAFDPEARAFAVGSLGHGGITRIDSDGTETRLFTPSEEGWTSLGIKLHPDTRELLICAVKDPSTDTSRSELWVVDLETGSQRGIPLQGSPADCNDVVAVGDSVYLTDREAPRIHRVDLSTDTSEVWLEHPELEPGLIGNNGIVLVGDALISGQYAPARLLRIPLDAPDQIAPVELSGDPIGTLPDGADGIVVFEGELVIAANLRVARVSSTDDWATATVTAADAPVAIAAVTVAEGRVYGLKGEILPFVLGTPESLPFELRALTLP